MIFFHFFQVLSQSKIIKRKYLKILAVSGHTSKSNPVKILSIEAKSCGNVPAPRLARDLDMPNDLKWFLDHVGNEKHQITRCLMSWKADFMKKVDFMKTFVWFFSVEPQYRVTPSSVPATSTEATEDQRHQRHHWWHEAHPLPMLGRFERWKSSSKNVGTYCIHVCIMCASCVHHVTSCYIYLYIFTYSIGVRVFVAVQPELDFLLSLFRVSGWVDQGKEHSLQPRHLPRPISGNSGSGSNPGICSITYWDLYVGWIHVPSCTCFNEDREVTYGVHPGIFAMNICPPQLGLLHSELKRYTEP